MSALGDKFRLAREARGRSLSEVAESIHIRSVYLDAIERGDWTAIGAPVYARGFIRTYARYLNLDPEAAIAEFRDELGPGSAEIAAAVVAQAPTTRPSPLVLALAAVAIALVGFAGYNYYEWKTSTAEPVSSVAASAPSAAPQAAAAETATPAAPAQPPVVALPEPSATPTHSPEGIEMRLSERSWIRVAVDGKAVLEGEFPAGTERTFHGKQITVRVGNAGGVEFSVNGKDVGKLGSNGDVVERTFKLAQD